MADSRAQTIQERPGTPLVSVVIPAYNVQAYVRQCIDSVLAQTFTDREIVVVNDAATDRTPDILREYEAAGRVRVVTHDKNRGLAAARNTGIRNARGTYVTFLDADDVWRAEKLEYQVKILKENPALVLLGSDEMIWQDGDALVFPPLPARPALSAVPWEQLVMGLSVISASNVIVCKECFEAVGLFDERLRAAEDRDQWLRITRRYGAGVMVSDGIVDAYRQHGGNMSSVPAHMKPNMELVLRKTFEQVRCPLTLRARAYSALYFDIALVYHEAGFRWTALRHVIQSLLVWPLDIRRTRRTSSLLRWKWMLRILLGRSVSARLLQPKAGQMRQTPAG